MGRYDGTIMLDATAEVSDALLTRPDGHACEAVVLISGISAVRVERN